MRARKAGSVVPARAGRMEEGEARQRGAREAAAIRPAARPPRTLGTLPVRGPGVRSACADDLPGGRATAHTRGFEKSGNFAREMLPTLQHTEKEKYVRR